MSDEARELDLYDGDTFIGRVNEEQARELLSFVENDMVQREGVPDLARLLSAWLFAGEL